MLLVSFSGSRYPKLAFSIPINKPVPYGLIGMENVSLGEQKPENETDNFGRCSLGCTTINRMVKCDRQGGIPYKFI